MSGTRLSRTRLLAVAATAAVATLSLTAFTDGSGARAEGASVSSHEDAKSLAGAKPVANASAVSANSKATTNRAAVTCQGSNTKTTAAPLARPLNHMLLTVTNTGSKPCYLYNYPAVQFESAQSVPPVIEASKPQAVVTLAPGESGYASVNLSAADGSGSNGYTAKSLAVYFSDRNGGSLSSAAHPSLPAKGVYIDDSIKVSYWQQDLDDAIIW
ncbi:DUF4232 domain-containing protein [Streptomyces sp. NPDC019937]|uniref:DUF4232 domain-containing protein n=1 Tax=Streptomyces sp. NPDC019937 TaxID=3154787 RepID=UPI0033C052BA